MKRLNFRFADILFFDSYFCFITKIASNNSPNESEYRQELYDISNCFHYNDIEHFINEIRHSLSSNCGYSISKRELDLLKSSVLNTCEQNRNEFPDEINQIITGFKCWQEHYIVASLSKNDEMVKLLSHSPIEKIYLSILERQDIPSEAITTIFHRLNATKCNELVWRHTSYFSGDNFSRKDVAIISAIFSHPDPALCYPFCFLLSRKSLPNNIKLMMLLNSISYTRYDALRHYLTPSYNNAALPQYILELLFSKYCTTTDADYSECRMTRHCFSNNKLVFLHPSIQSRLFSTFKNNLDILPSYKELLTEYYYSDILSLT